jgi:steroid 5-alpha reductase family enzyme
MTRDLIPVGIAYGIAIAGAVIALITLEGSLLLVTLWADLIATLIIFGFSRAYKNSSFYDAYWSVIPPLMVVFWMVYHESPQVDPARQAMVMILVWLWGIRLTANWGTHWTGMKHEDWRYAPIREKAGRLELLADFGGIHLFPTLIVFLACLPAYAAVSVGERPLNWLDAVAFVITAGAILIELIADLQLHAFVASKKPGDIMQTGLWRYSRHPNYFGEMSFWIGLMLFGLAAHPQGWWWIMPGAVAMTLMFYLVSIPLMDTRSAERRPEYRQHMEKVSAIVPWFPKP